MANQGTKANLTTVDSELDINKSWKLHRGDGILVIQSDERGVNEVPFKPLYWVIRHTYTLWNRRWVSSLVLCSSSLNIIFVSKSTELPSATAKRSNPILWSATQLRKYFQYQSRACMCWCVSTCLPWSTFNYLSCLSSQSWSWSVFQPSQSEDAAHWTTILSLLRVLDSERKRRPGENWGRRCESMQTPHRNARKQTQWPLQPSVNGASATDDAYRLADSLVTSGKIYTCVSVCEQKTKLDD